MRACVCVRVWSVHAQAVRDLQGGNGLGSERSTALRQKPRPLLTPPASYVPLLAENKVARHAALSEAAHAAVSEEYQRLWQAVHAAPGAVEPEYTQPWKAQA